VVTQATSAVAPRVATLLPFPLTDKGGINTFVGNLTDALAHDFEVTQWVVASDTFKARSGRPLAQLSVAARHVLAMLRLKPDIVHTHEHPALLAAAIVYRALAVRRVHLVHTIHVHPSRQRSLWKRLTLGWMLRRCTSVTVVARATADRLDMVATPTPENVHIIHGAAHMRSREATDVLADALKQSLRIGDGPTICQISPLNLPGKVAGVACLLQATALVRRHRPDVQLLLVGGGDMRPEVESLARQAGVAECTYLTDYLDDVSVALALTDVYCQITHQDACPLSLLEAMCVGKPVIASRIGGIPELVTDGVDGTLVSNDPQEIASRVLELLMDSRRAHELGHRAAATVKTRFTWQRVACKFAAVYGLERRPWRLSDASPSLSASRLTREPERVPSADRS
jgi:glycosyltransferase involved in cell wall biosynthesis